MSWMIVMQYINVSLRKLLSARKSHVRDTNLFTGAIPNQVRNSQTSRFISVPGQNSERLSRGDSVGLRLQSVVVVVADVSWRNLWNRNRIALRVRSSVVSGK